MSTDDRVTLASVSNCESTEVVVRHDCWSSVVRAIDFDARTTPSRVNAGVSAGRAPAVDADRMPFRRGIDVVATTINDAVAPEADRIAVHELVAAVTVGDRPHVSHHSRSITRSLSRRRPRSQMLDEGSRGRAETRRVV